AGKYNQQLTPRGRVPVLIEVLGHLRHHRALRRQHRGAAGGMAPGVGRRIVDREVGSRQIANRHRVRQRSGRSSSSSPNGAPLGAGVAIRSRVRPSDRLCHLVARKVEMKLGVALPFIDVAVGGNPCAIREFAQTAEEIGYQDLAAPDHVLGVNVASRPDWGDRNTSADLFHDPFVLFGFLAACTRNIEFSTQVLILAQRQAVLVAKQAASLDVLCGGRFRLGVGVGWNPVEFVGLNENFRNRGRRSEEQVEVMNALWRDQHVVFKGKWHAIEDAGINPRPKKGKIPLWFGGHADVTLRRTAKWGDGWIMLAHAKGKEAEGEFDKLRRYVK